MSNENSLTPGRVNESVQSNEPFDGAMSAALTRGHLSRRQRRPHLHRHQRRPHQRHFHHLKVNNNNDPSHSHSRPRHHENNYRGQYRYTSHQQTCREHQCDKLKNDEKRAHDIEEPEDSAERRPKVNPIFLWALQREQRIIEVRCEDYDKRNRIKLTKTPHGWRSIPRTSSNVYSTCSCVELTCIPAAKDGHASSSPSVSSTCVPHSISSSESTSLSVSPSPQSMLLSSGSEMYNVKRRQNGNNQIKKNQCKKEVTKEKKLYTHDSRHHMSENHGSDAMSSCRNSQQRFDSSYCNDQDDNPDDVDYEEDDEYHQYEFVDGEDCREVKEVEMRETNENSDNFRMAKCGKTTFKYIDLEKARKNQLLQPRVILEPLNTSTMRLNSSREHRKLDDGIEMIVVEENDEEYDKNENEEDQDDETNKQLNNVEYRTNNLSEQNEVLQQHYTKTENSEDEIEEVEESDYKDEIEGLDEENTTVFEYDDRDSADMMDDDELDDHDEISKPTKLYSPIVDKTNNVIHQSQAISLGDDIIEEEISKAEDITIDCKQKQIFGNISQVPDLKPINNDSLEKTLHKFPTKNQQVKGTSIERLLPSPPCSVTCSEDASQIESSQNLTITSNRRRREAPDLIEVNPTEWRKRGALLRPAHQLRELIEKSGHSIPDPLLVPRDCLPALAANPGVEIPRLLVTRPELRLPEAVLRPELLADPDILVISLSHLQQVLDAVPEPIKFYIQERVGEYGLPNNVTMLPSMNSDRKRLCVKPIGSLMPTPIDLSQHSIPEAAMENSIFHGRDKCFRQESEVTSTARLPGDDSRLWHPLFGCRGKILRRDDASCPNMISHPLHDRFHKQRPPNYQQTHQDTDQHRASWHRTTLAS